MLHEIHQNKLRQSIFEERHAWPPSIAKICKDEMKQEKDQEQE